LNQASQFVQAVQERQGFLIGSIEEVAYRKGYISKSQIEKLAKPYIKSGYGQYLLSLD
jgi:glucose-1-phosphate thymidylyltransferase